MSDFIPINQSTYVHGKWPRRYQNQRNYNNPYQQFSQWKSGYTQRRWGYNSVQNSNNNYNGPLYHRSDSNYSRDNNQRSIDAYLHPSMLEDPWEKLRQRNN